MKTWLSISAALAALGAAYSFMLFFSRLTQETCTIGSVCPMLFGQPVCLYGFIGFSAVIGLLFGMWRCAEEGMRMRLSQVLFWLTLFGMLFALFYLIQELFIEECPGGACRFSLGYPSCLSGFLLFGGLFFSARRISRLADGKTEDS